MTTVQRSTRSAVSPAEMWQRIGNFHGMADWHPAITGSTPKEDGEVRELALADGALVVERRLSQTDRSYTYRILDPGPLPVSGYEATISVGDGDDGGSVVDWQATFEPAGASEADAVEVIAGIFEAGFDAL